MISILGSLLNFTGLEENRYTLLGSQGPFEVRLYHRMAFAKVSVAGNFTDAFLEGKKHLLEYLDGSNLRLEKISHTSLFFQMQKQTSWEVGVFLNSIRVNSDIPRPINRLIRLKELPPGKSVALRCSGINTEEVFERRDFELRKWAKHKSYSPLGNARIVYIPNYCSLPFVKEKELLIDVL